MYKNIHGNLASTLKLVNTADVTGNAAQRPAPTFRRTIDPD